MINKTKMKAAFSLIGMLAIGMVLGGMIIGAVIRDRVDGLREMQTANGLADKVIAIVEVEDTERQHRLHIVLQPFSAELETVLANRRNEIENILDRMEKTMANELSGDEYLRWQAARERLRRLSKTVGNQ